MRGQKILKIIQM